MWLTSHRYVFIWREKSWKFWDYCFLFTIIIFVLLGLSFAASFPAAGLGRSLKLKNGRKKWHLWYMITSLLSVISQMPLVLYFWGPVTDGLIEGKTKAYKWILAGPRQYPVTDRSQAVSCHWPLVTENGHYTNPAVSPLAGSNTFSYNSHMECF